MLQLVLGRSGFGKTEFVFDNIKKLTENGEKNILLITPEQFSFVAERRLLCDLRESGISNVDFRAFPPRFQKNTAVISFLFFPQAQKLF